MSALDTKALRDLAIKASSNAAWPKSAPVRREFARDVLAAHLTPNVVLALLDRLERAEAMLAEIDAERRPQ